MHHEDEHDRLEKQLELRGGRADGRIELACESLFSSGADANGKPSETDGAASARRHTSKAAANGTRSPLSSQRRRPNDHAPQPSRCWRMHTRLSGRAWLPKTNVADRTNVENGMMIVLTLICARVTQSARDAAQSYGRRAEPETSRLGSDPSRRGHAPRLRGSRPAVGSAAFDAQRPLRLRQRAASMQRPYARTREARAAG